jgi:hypothetical protein
MSDLTGLTRENCANGCNADGCIIGGSRQPRCMHPLKGGPSIALLNDPATMVAYDAACAAIGVGNFLKDGAES